MLPSANRNTPVQLASASKKELTDLVKASGSSLQDLNGIGPSGAARLIGDIGDIRRFASRGHFASWNGTAPLEPHRTPGRLLRRPATPPPVRGREPAHQLRPAHHG